MHYPYLITLLLLLIGINNYYCNPKMRLTNRSIQQIKEDTDNIANEPLTTKRFTSAAVHFFLLLAYKHIEESDRRSI